MKQQLRVTTIAVSFFAWTLLLLSSHSSAQAEPTIQAPKNAIFDPQEVFYQGHIFLREAEALAQKGKFADSLAKYRSAQTFFETVAKFHPEWRRSMVEQRITLNAQTVKDLTAKAENELRIKEISAAELEGGVIRPVTTLPIPNAPEIKINPRIAELEQEVRRLRSALASPANQVNQEAVRAAEMEKQRDEMKSNLAKANQELLQLRQQMAATPLQSELEKLNDRAKSLEMERAAMKYALDKSSDRQIKSEETIRLLDEEIRNQKQDISDLRNHLDIQGKKNNEVVQGQLRQMKQLEEVVKQKEVQLTAAQNEITSLKTELQQTKDAFTELQTERNTLLRERDQLSDLLKVSEGDRITKLIEQHMVLATELRSAKDRIELLQKNSFQSNEQLAEAKRDLSLAKLKIREFQTEKRRQEENIQQLELQLKQDKRFLADDKNSASQEEAETLRDIVNRRTKQLERTKQAASLLIEAAKEKAKVSDSAEYKEALSLLNAEQEVTLTPEEEQALATRKIDGEIYSPYAGSREQVERNLATMRQQISIYTDVAKSAFSEQRYNGCRDIYEMILKIHPGEITTMRRLGIVQLRLGEIEAATKSFQTAVENDESQALSHRFYGLALYKSEQYSQAAESVQTSSDIDPQDSQSYTILGNILLVQDQYIEAENAYNRAISLEPKNHEALHNLAVLYQATKRTKEAIVTYQESLKQGGMQDPSLESMKP